MVLYHILGTDLTKLVEVLLLVRSLTRPLIEEGMDENELIVTRHSQFMTPINIINIYGQQECRIPKETVGKHWNELLEIVGKIEARKEMVVIIGDFSRRLPNVPEGATTSSYGGRLVDEL